MSDLEVVAFRPEADQYAWTFGGAAPVARIRTPVVLEVFTEDAFFGRVRSDHDLGAQPLLERREVFIPQGVPCGARLLDLA